MTKELSIEIVAGKIFEIRGRKVMLDRDLALLYGVDTRYLNKAVKRNVDRFPQDFMYQLTRQELTDLMFQTGTSSWGGIRKLPYVFTEQGVAMLSSVLRSKRAIQVNIMIMRTFTKLREILATHKDLLTRLDALEKKHSEHDQNIKAIFEAIRQLIEQPIEEKPKPRIGFHS